MVHKDGITQITLKPRGELLDQVLRKNRQFLSTSVTRWHSSLQMIYGDHHEFANP